MKKSENIFILWYQGKTSMPELVRLCYNSVLKNSNGHRVVLLDSSSIFDWIDPFPEKVQQKFDNNIFSLQLKSDLIRLSLLKQYGGLWLDATVFVSKKIPDEVFKMPFFTVIRKEAEKEDISGKISPFLLGRNINNENSQKLFNFSQELMMEYIEQEDDLINYLLIENILNIGINNDKVINKLIDNLYKNKKDILGLEKSLNNVYESDVLKILLENNLFSKLNFHTSHFKRNENNKLTNYGKLFQI